MKTYILFTLGFLLMHPMPAAAGSATASASLGGLYDVELQYRAPSRFAPQAPTVHVESELHEGLRIQCVSNLEFPGAVLQIRLYRAGTRELVTTKDLPLRLGGTRYVDVESENDCQSPAAFEPGLRSIGVREPGMDVEIPGTAQVLRLRLESGQSLAEGRFVRSGESYDLQGFRLDPPATASLYWDIYDRSSKQFIESYRRSEARFTNAPDGERHQGGAPVTH